MSKIELGKLWPFGNRRPKRKPPISYRIEFSSDDREAQGKICADMLEPLNFDTHIWRTYIDGMARLHQGTQYDDGTVFAEVPLDGGRIATFQTGLTNAQIKIRGLGGTEIITWGEKHTRAIIKAPTLQVIRPGNLDPDAVLYTFVPPVNSKLQTRELGKLVVADYTITPQDARAYCQTLHAQIERPVVLLKH